MKIRRRDFVKALAKGVPGVLLLNTLPTSALAAAPEEKDIIYRTLGRTGIRLPLISAGIIPSDNLRFCRTIFRSGILHFDSAHVYGRNSSTVGQMLKEFGRDKFVISTKVLLPSDHTTGLYTDDATEELFFSQLDSELEHLGISCVDILYIHKPAIRENIINPKVLGWLKKAKETGKAKYIGTSNHGNQAACIDAMIEAGVYDIALVATNDQHLDGVDDAINRAAAAGMGVIAMKGHAGGFLDKEKTQPVNKVAAVKWALQNPNVCTITLTFRSYDDLDLHLPLMRNITMTESERNDLKEFSHRAEYASLFCYGCRDCVAQCPKNLPIPDAMRAYMYTYGYNDRSKALATLGKLDISSASCNDCETCVVKCRHNFSIGERMADMCRLKENSTVNFA